MLLLVENMLQSNYQRPSAQIIDEIDRGRAQQYALLATLLSRSPDAQLISRLALLRGDASAMGNALSAVGAAAASTNENELGREYFELFVGLGRGVLLPYSSHYLTGALYGRPLARLRQTLQRLGIEKAEASSEPEDHAAILCEIMAGLILGTFSTPAGTDREFFELHLAGWIGRFFADLERARPQSFYARVGALGRLFVDVEREAFIAGPEKVV
jgi:TorA maturation chaperone TorD